MNSPEPLPNLDSTPPGFKSGFVAIVGKPSAGKSTLLNAFLGQKISIVTHKPQTTRRRILGILTQPAAQAIFIDTPGMHQPEHKLGEYMLEEIHSAIADADVVVFLCDIGDMPNADDRRIAQALNTRSGPEPRPVILAINKMDHPAPPRELKGRIEAYWSLAPTPDGAEPPAPWDWIMLSATRGDNRAKLLDKIIAALPEGPLYYPADQVTDKQEREIAAELIREQVLLHVKQEIPHGVAVAIEQYNERASGSVHIGATIYVERDSHKAIIIGSGGSMLKQIGADARHEIQRLIGTNVFLELWVKVRKNWRSDEREVRKLGYHREE
jgi:GTP-binding protein Era